MNPVADGAAVAATMPWVAWWGTAATLAVRASLPHHRAPEPCPMTLDVVVPAHDEAAVIGRLLRSLQDQRGPARPGTVLVVADHCTDATAAVARAHGAEVLERDGGAQGKPPALRDGLARLRDAPGRGDAVVLLDADCRCDPGTLSALAAELAGGASVAQAAYEIEDDDRGAVRSSLRLGFSLRNVVRATGGRQLGLPCLLFGSGIALRWDAVDDLSFADPRISGTGDDRPVADDVLMTLELLGAGHAIRFAPGARVTAAAPDDDADLGAQRLRWEAGQALMWRRAGRTAVGLVRRGRVRDAVALVDWMAPPLAPSVLSFAGVGAVVAGLAAFGAVSPVVLVVPAVAGAALLTYLVVGVAQLEGWGAAAGLVAGAPEFLRWKTSLYLRHRQARRPSTTGRTA